MLTSEQQIFRRSGLGGSDVAAICGLSPFRKPIDVYLEKTAEGVPDDSPPSDAQRFGSVLEPVIADEYERRHDAIVVGPFTSMRVPCRPWQLFTLDRLVLRRGSDALLPSRGLPSHDSIERVLEIKTAGIGTASTYGDDGTDELPAHVICQVAWYLSAVGVEQATVAALINTSDYREFHVQRDRALESYLLDEARRFWKRVEERNPPTPDGSESFTRYLRDRFSSTSGYVLPATPETDAAAWQLRKLRQTIKRLEEQAATAEQILKVAIGDADGIETLIGRVSFKHEKTGRVAMASAWADLADRAGFDERTRQHILDKHRGKPPRKFYVPRSWNKPEDKPAWPIEKR